MDVLLNLLRAEAGSVLQPGKWRGKLATGCAPSNTTCVFFFMALKRAVYCVQAEGSEGARGKPTSGCAHASQCMRSLVLLGGVLTAARALGRGLGLAICVLAGELLQRLCWLLTPTRLGGAPELPARNCSCSTWQFATATAHLHHHQIILAVVRVAAVRHCTRGQRGWERAHRGGSDASSDRAGRLLLLGSQAHLNSSGRS